MSERATVHHGDCREVLAGLEVDSVDACCTDPPYELSFMGKAWDRRGVAFAPATWAAVYRVLKPGAHLVAFGGTRTYHRMVCAIEDAGFEIRDQLAWVYASGFPKSHNIGKAIDRMVGAEREVVGANPNHRPVSGVNYAGIYGGGNTGADVIAAPATPEAAAWEGWGTALKPAHEPIVLARKPLAERTVAAQVLATGTGALNVDAARVPCEERPLRVADRGKGQGSVLRGGLDGSLHGSLAAGTTTAARWPANLAHDGSPEVLAAFAAAGERGAAAPIRGTEPSVPAKGDVVHGYRERVPGTFYGDTGSAARFYQACPWTEEELLIWRAKAIMAEWNPELANTADNYSFLSNEAVASALSSAVALAARGGLALNAASCRGLPTSVTPSELRRISEAAIIAILSIGSGFWSELLLGKHFQSGSHVKVAAAREPIGTTTITISQWRSDGSAEAVTFGCTRRSMEAGAQGLSASRFHFSAKADTDDRAGSSHPTIKPLALMEWLVRLVCPPGGTVLDPFAGTGVTGEACLRQGFRAVLIEREADYHRDILYRMGRLSGADAPLFSWEAA